MKFLKNAWLFLLAALLFYGCDKVTTERTYAVRLPTFVSMSTLRLQAEQMVVLPQPLESTGKIYVYGDYLFINEPMKGIHIYNNADPKSPVPLTFLKVPGNVDMAINAGMLYVDSYVDLLTFDLADPAKPTLVHRNEDVFVSLYQRDYTNAGSDKLMVVSGYRDTVISASDERIYKPYIKEVDLVYDNVNAGGNYGQGGSMARFTLSMEHLYAVDHYKLHLFQVSDKRKPAYIKDIELGWGIETIFPYKDHLFIGSNTGMFIYDVTTPGEPEQVSRYQHMRACDPVVVNDDYAFVTLRTGVACGGAQNVLEVVDIKDLTNPRLVKSYPMKNPHGLGLADDVLYLCEGAFGFKSFRVSDVHNVANNALESFENLVSTDVIVAPKSLVVIGENGVSQYDYTDKAQLKLLSKIQLAKSK
ncbi:LVIVD repeat-containing protein [Sphingobacterium griseoflavum]|uniref:LVIVD repeat-containing protein n=1 Tax=Sphingobacterium griseoflavum TaxID=1474952 RepID=A0ABQ3HVD3_9SPHI|nr:hypothetical protein [Sphingobacterium griseoflavum]GHE30304.1 hypothetical protein GCM10017764_11530 [Sphingobacterium griseoflavum]